MHPLKTAPTKTPGLVVFLFAAAAPRGCLPEAALKALTLPFGKVPALEGLWGLEASVLKARPGAEWDWGGGRMQGEGARPSAEEKELGEEDCER